MLFNVDNAGQISFVSKLEEDKKAETNSKFSAKHLFQTRDKMGVSDVADTILNTTHQNQVCAKFSAVKVKKKNKFDGCRVSKDCHFFYMCTNISWNTFLAMMAVKIFFMCKCAQIFYFLNTCQVAYSFSHINNNQMVFVDHFEGIEISKGQQFFYPKVEFQKPWYYQNLKTQNTWN